MSSYADISLAIITDHISPAQDIQPHHTFYLAQRKGHRRHCKTRQAGKAYSTYWLIQDFLLIVWKIRIRIRTI